MNVFRIPGLTFQSVTLSRIGWSYFVHDLMRFDFLRVVKGLFADEDALMGLPV